MTHEHEHEPTPEFRDYLEFEVARSFRHEVGAGAERRRARRSRVRTGLVAAICLLLGAGGTMVSAQVQDAQRRNELLESARAELQLAEVRMRLAEESLAEARRKAAIGAITSSELATAVTDAEAMQLETRRAQLNMEEIQASSQAPRDGLNAPPVAGRDFVRERLLLEVASAQRRLRSAEEAMGEQQRRARLGIISTEEVQHAERTVAQLRSTLEMAMRRVDLRRQFAAGSLSSAAVTRELQHAELLHELQASEQQLRAAEQRLARLKELRAAGLVTQLEVMRAEVELMERKLELEQAQRQLQRLGPGGDSTP